MSGFWSVRVRSPCDMRKSFDSLHDAVPFEDGPERRREITAAELGALLSGIDLAKATRRKRYRRAK